MLIVMEPGRCRIDGTVYGIDDPAQSVYPISWARYINGNGNHTEQQISVDLKAGIITIRTHPFGIYPISYHASPGLLIISHSAGHVARELVRRGDKVEPDQVGLWEAMTFSVPLLRRTLFQSISKNRIGETLSLRLRDGSLVSHNYWRPQLYGPGGNQRRDFLGDAVELLKSLFKDAADWGPCLMPLSGGLDSRLAAAMLQRKGVDLRAFTFGGYGSAEVTIGRRVAETLNIPWQQVELRPEDYIKYGNHVVDLTGGTLSGIHMHLFSCLHKIEHVNSLCLHGYLGDQFAGDYATGLHSELNKEQAIAELLKKRLPGVARRFIPKRDLEGVLEDVERILQECQEKNPPGCLVEYFVTTERHNLLAYIPAVMETKVPVKRVYATQEFADFFLSLPPMHRKLRALFYKACKALFPKLFALPSTQHLYGDRIPEQAQKWLVRGRNGLQYATSWLTSGSRPVFSPYIYEQPGHIVRRYLWDRVVASAETVAPYLECDVRSLCTEALSLRHRQPMIPLSVLYIGGALNFAGAPYSKEAEEHLLPQPTN